MKKLLLLLLTIVSLTSQAQTVTDVEGNVYKTVVIGDQEWMAEELKTTKYNDSTDIMNQLDSKFDWIYFEKKEEATSGYCGDRLYNFYVVETGKLCPIGWKVPSKEDWEVLIHYTKDETGDFEYSLMSSADHTDPPYWDSGTGSYKGPGNDFYGFNMRPKNCSGTGRNIAYWTTSKDEDEEHKAYQISVSNNRGAYSEFRAIRSLGKSNAKNVRCLTAPLTTSIATSTKEISDDSLDIYPNPFTDVINVNLSTGTYIIVALDGSVVKRGNVTPKINVSDIASGAYFLKISINNEIKVTKIIKK